MSFFQRRLSTNALLEVVIHDEKVEDTPENQDNDAGPTDEVVDEEEAVALDDVAAPSTPPLEDALEYEPVEDVVEVGEEQPGQEDIDMDAGVGVAPVIQDRERAESPLLEGE